MWARADEMSHIYLIGKWKELDETNIFQTTFFGASEGGPSGTSLRRGKGDVRLLVGKTVYLWLDFLAAPEKLCFPQFYAVGFWEMSRGESSVVPLLSSPWPPSKVENFLKDFPLLPFFPWLNTSEEIKYTGAKLSLQDWSYSAFTFRPSRGKSN